MSVSGLSMGRKKVLIFVKKDKMKNKLIFTAQRKPVCLSRAVGNAAVM